MMSDDEILERGGTEDDIREYAKQNGADLTKEDTEHAKDCCGDHSSHTHLGCCSEGKEEEVCELCGGKDGEHEEVSSMEAVYPGEPHMADIGSRPCPNYQPNEEDYDA